MIASTSSSRGLVAVVLLATTLSLNQNAVSARPLSSSVNMVRQAAFDSRSFGDAQILTTSLLGHDVEQKRMANEVELTERSLITDLLGGLLEPLSIIPGVVQVQDILFGDGETDTGLFGKLSGLLLAVEPQSAEGDGSGSGSNPPDGSSDNTTDPAGAAAKASYRYSLMASKNQKTQVFLMPVHQANAKADGSDDNSTDTADPNNANNDTMTVKMMLHMLDTAGVPVVMCASYGSTPPTDLTIDECSGDASAAASSDSNATSTDASMQLFSYSKSTGALKPMFKKAADEPSATATGASNTTEPASATPSDKVATEMRLRFAADDAAPAPPQASPSASSSAAAPAPTAPDATTANLDSTSRRITLGRQFVARPMGGKQRLASARKEAGGDAKSTASP